MKFLSTLKEILTTLPTKATDLILKNQAVESLTGLLVKFIKALGLHLDESILSTIVAALVTTVIYFIINWISSYFSKEEKETYEEESMSVPEFNSEEDCCDFDFSVENCCDCEFK